MSDILSHSGLKLLLCQHLLVLICNGICIINTNILPSNSSREPRMTSPCIPIYSTGLTCFTSSVTFHKILLSDMT